MNKHVFLIIRYSVLTKGRKSWAIGRNNSFEEYKEELFNKDRLALHESLFERLTVPSLISGIGDRENITVFIITSDELPKDNLEKLNKIIAGKSAFEIFSISRDDQVFSGIKKRISGILNEYEGDVCYATVRLDDDDALSSYFFKELDRYIEPNLVGHVISFSKGFYGIFKDNFFQSFSLLNTPKLALGLSYIGFFNKDKRKEKLRTIYCLGKHTKVDEKAPMVINSTTPSYIRTIHVGSDIYRDEDRFKRQEFKNWSDMVDPKSIAHLFFSFNESKMLGEGAFQRYEAFRKGIKTTHGTFLFYNFKNEKVEHYDLDELDGFDNLSLCFFEEGVIRVMCKGDCYYLGCDSTEEGVKLTNSPEKYSLIFDGNVLYISFLDEKVFLSSSIKNESTLLVGHKKRWESYTVNL